MPRQTRSKGGDPELDDSETEFWLPHQKGVVKPRVKALKIKPDPHSCFITFKIPVDKCRSLDFGRARKPEDPSAAGAFPSLETTPGKQTQSVEARKDWRADSAVDVDTPATDIDSSESAVEQSTSATRSGSRPAHYRTPPQPPVSPVTPSSQISEISPVIPPQQETLSHNTDQDLESQVTATVGQGTLLNSGLSLVNKTAESNIGANEQRTEAELGISIQQPRSYPSITLSVSDPSSALQQTEYSLEPSPKTLKQNFEPQPAVAFPLPVSHTDSDATSDPTHPVGNIDEQKLIVSSLNEYHIDKQVSVPVTGRHTPDTHQIPVTSVSYSPATEPAAASAKSDIKPFLTSPKKRSPLKRQRSSTPSLAGVETPPVKRKAGRPSRSSAQKQLSESAVQQFRPSLIIKLPIKKGYILDENMAPVRDPQDVSNSLKEIVQNMFDTTQTVVGYVPQSQDLLIDRMVELTQNLAHLQNITNVNTAPNNPIHNIRIAPEIVDYVDDGRNPDIFTRDFVELVQRGNAVMNGKKKAFNSFAEIYARELKKGIRGVDKQVDVVMENAGLIVAADEEQRGKEKEKGHENGESFKNS